jgi:hypothetical protein
MVFRSPKNLASDSGPAQPLIPIEVSRDCDVAPCSCVGALINPFDRIGFKFLVPGGRLAWAGEYGKPIGARTDLDSRVAENQISRDWQICA